MGGTSVGTIQRSGILERDAHVSKQMTKPDNLNSSVSHNAILRLSRGAQDNLLFLGAPRNEGIAKENAKSRDGSTISYIRSLVGITQLQRRRGRQKQRPRQSTLK